MDHHFASSWLKSLSTKLDSLVEWTFAAGKKDAGTTHRNLFREFFSAPFQKTLALVDEKKKTEFLNNIERNLYKFEAQSQQFPLGCLCALLQHGKDAPQTQEKVGAWVDFLLCRLRGGGTQARETARDVMDTILSAQFRRFVPLMAEPLRDRLADGLGEQLPTLDEEVQKQVMEALPAIPVRIEKVVSACTDELNTWLQSAPRFPATPMCLANTLAKMEHPLVRFFTAVRDTSKKESFLVAVALALQGLRTRFRWMCMVEPELEAIGSELQRRLFYVEGQGPVMEMWLSSRLKKYNAEVTTRLHAVILSDVARREQLRDKIQALFPDRAPGDPESGWVPLDGPTRISDLLVTWLIANSAGFFCPRHTLMRETIAGLLRLFGGLFEVEPLSTRARLQLSPVQLPSAGVLAKAFPPQPPPPGGEPAPRIVSLPLIDVGGGVVPAVQSPAGVPPAAPLGLPGPLVLVQPAVPGAAAGTSAVGVSGLSAPMVLSAAAAAAVSNSIAAVAVTAAPEAKAPIELALAPVKPVGEVDNLVDLLLNEALDGVPSENRAKVLKVSQGVYRIGAKEVTLHTLSGRLFVYRVGDVVRHCPIKTMLQEEGVLPPDQPHAAHAGALSGTVLGATAVAAGAGQTVPVVSVGVADTSSVARIAQQAAQISAGVTTTTIAPVSQRALPFGQHKTDAQALMSKRVEAATRAMDASKQIVRRLINFEDDKFLRKLMKKGLQYDKQWQTSYEEYCTSRGLPRDANFKMLDKESIATFIERNMANSINQDWAKKIIHGDQAQDGGKKEKKNKKEKKDKDKKQKKDRKRKASDSSSSEDRAGATAESSNALALVPFAPEGTSPAPGAGRGHAEGLPGQGYPMEMGHMDMHHLDMGPALGLPMGGPLGIPQMPWGMGGIGGAGMPWGMPPPGMMGDVPGMPGMPPGAFEMPGEHRASAKKAKKDKEEKAKRSRK
mmetsp:Transcript_9917/g.26195  ORF Transcript_9917/g.26195 Transcript_9917/m.26195 type:complete len:952 (-) Transcript_9917:273-3128(-)